jgi:hypothetical protein
VLLAGLRALALDERPCFVSRHDASFRIEPSAQTRFVATVSFRAIAQ